MVITVGAAYMFKVGHSSLYCRCLNEGMCIVGFTCRRKTAVYAERHKKRQCIKLLLVKQIFIIEELTTIPPTHLFIAKQQPNEKGK